MHSGLQLFKFSLIGHFDIDDIFVKCLELKINFSIMTIDTLVFNLDYEDKLKPWSSIVIDGYTFKLKEYNKKSLIFPFK